MDSTAGKEGGLMGGKNSPPPQPDWTQAVERQAGSSQQAVGAQTAANRPNQTGPFGSSSWQLGPDGQWTQTTGLAGGLQQGAQGLEGQIGNQGPLGTGDQARQQAINSIYGQSTSRLDPQFAQAEERERSMLAGQGLDPGSEAYDNEMGNFNRSKNDAYQTALNNAVQGGTAAQQATFGENLASQMAPYQQLGALQGLGGQPGFTAAGAAQPAQYLPAALAGYQGGLQGYGIQQQGKNSSLGGLGQLGGSLGAAAILA